jgi:hypothetical protein
MVGLSKAKWTKSTWPLIVSWKPNAPFFHGKKIKLVCWDMLLKEYLLSGRTNDNWESEKHLYARACVFSLYNYVHEEILKKDWLAFRILFESNRPNVFLSIWSGFMKIMAVLFLYIYIWIGFSKINILEFNWNICACIKKAHVQYFYFRGCLKYLHIIFLCKI